MLREIVAELIPPVLLRPARRLYDRYRAVPAPPSHIPSFEGCYGRLEDVPCGLNGYDDDDMANRSSVIHLEWLRASFPTGIIDQSARHSVLPLVVASRLAEGAFTVLDIGGGGCAGLSEILDHACDIDLATFHYINVETPAMCRLIRAPVDAALKAKFGTSSFVTITEKLPSSLPPPLIVNAAGIIQYVPDYRGLLSRFAHLAPDLLILSMIALSDHHPTFACQQIHWGYKLAYRVVNRNEFVSEMGSLGFHLSFTVDHAIALTFKDMPVPVAHATMIFRRDAVRAAIR